MSLEVAILLYLFATFATSNLQQGTGLQNQVQDCFERDGNFCPTGFFYKDGCCKCRHQPSHVIRCQGNTSTILKGYCLTFDEETNTILVGLCLRYLNSTTDKQDYMYYQLQSNISLLNEDMCQSMNRTGTLCGRCLPEHYPLAYSYNLNCIRCPNIRWNWVRYIMAAYLPLTVFYLAVLFLKLNTTSSHLFAFVSYCQALSMPTITRLMLTGKFGHYKELQIAASIYGIWNLDFFRPFYTDLCLGISILPTLALDYAIAVYPLLLMMISYLLITLYDRNCRVVIFLWRPFQVLFSLFRKRWDIRTSIIDAFATFFFLSYLRLLTVSFDLLAPIRVYHLYGDTYNYTTALYISGDIEYFGKEHLPYGILAIVMLCVFAILPVAILALYQFAFFQKFLNTFPFDWYILNAFMHSFHGCYKDGKEPGTRDCRWFASSYFVLRIITSIVICATHTELVYSIAISLLIFYTILLAIFQPFKLSLDHYNTIYLVFLQILIFLVAIHSCLEFSDWVEPELHRPFLLLILACICAPVVYALVCSVLWVYTHRKFGQDLVHRVRARITGYTPLDDLLPDRLENSGDYNRENLSAFSANK